VALLAKNEPFLAATSAAYLIKKAADEIHERVGVYFNATDVGEEVPRVLAALTH
jgi:NAD(P)H-hydrate repair Nnr-like enzyme with NAD(P)H-hydrate dehydratase domain